MVVGLLEQKRTRPAGNGTGSDEQVDAGSGLSLSAAGDICPDSGVVLTSAEVYQVIRGRLAAHVIVKRPEGRITTRSYVNLKFADRAVRRARERGCAATVVMVRQDVAPLIGGDI